MLLSWDNENLASANNPEKAENRRKTRSFWQNCARFGIARGLLDGGAVRFPCVVHRGSMKKARPVMK